MPRPSTLATAPRPCRDTSSKSGTGEFTNGFTLGTGGSARSFQLKTTYPSEVDRNVSPVITPSDFTQELQVTYASPVPWLDGNGPATRMTDRVMLVPAGQLKADAEITTRSFTFGDVQVTTRFKFWKPEADMIVKTLPVAEWVDTVITGLTSTPITLTIPLLSPTAPAITTSPRNSSSNPD